MSICPLCNKEHNTNRKKMCGSCRVKRSRKYKKERAVKLLGSKCMKCGYDKCLRALQFHHIDPTQKDIQISTSKNNSWEKVKEELKKCILVCSNCHAEIHDEIDKNIAS